MAERLPRYRPLGISLVAPTRVDYASTGAAQAAGYERLSSALDRISSYAFEKAGQRAKIEGEEFGYKLGQNPEQIKTALEAGASIDDIVGDSDTIFGAASRAAVGAQLRVELETDVRSKLAQLSAAVEGGDVLDPADVETEIDAITEGHASLLSQFGGKYAAQYRATVGTLAAPVYKSALEQSYKLRNAAQAAKFVSTLESSKDIFYNIADDFQGGQTVVDGKTVWDIDAKFAVLSRSIMDQAINTKNPTNISVATDFLKNMQKNAKINALRKHARENPNDFNLDVGLFGNKTALYASLDENDKEMVRDEIRDEIGAMHQLRVNQIAENNEKYSQEYNQLVAILFTEPHNSETRIKAASRVKAIALSGVLKVDQDILDLAENPKYKPLKQSDPTGVEIVRDRIIDGYITDRSALAEALFHNNVFYKEANEVKLFFDNLMKSRRNGVEKAIKDKMGVFGDAVDKDTGVFMYKNVPVIYKMNEKENLKRAESGEILETLLETTQRFLDSGAGQAQYKEIKDQRDGFKSIFIKGPLSKINWDTVGPEELRRIAEQIDKYEPRKRQAANYKREFEAFAEMLEEYRK